MNHISHFSPVAKPIVRRRLPAVNPRLRTAALLLAGIVAGWLISPRSFFHNAPNVAPVILITIPIIVAAVLVRTSATRHRRL